MSVEIQLSRGHVAVVDDVDADLAKLKWSADNYGGTKHRSFYARRTIERHGVKRTFSLHRVIGARMGIAGDVDHKDQNGLNCTRGNLREATVTQNAANRSPSRTNTSGYKGVSWKKSHRKWQASIRKNGRPTYLGQFDDPTEAAKAYDRAAREVFGEFAWLNFPEAT